MENEKMLEFDNSDTLSDMGSIDDIFTKFDSIVIENDQRIEPEDVEFCENEQNKYMAAVNVYKPLLKAFNEYKEVSGIDSKHWDAGYISWREEDDTINIIDKLKKRFISNVCHYFSKKYNVTIETSEFKGKYNTDITYSQIVDEIFIQLDGFNFKEKAVNEIKNNLKNKVGSYKKITVNKNKVTIPSYVYMDHWEKKWGILKLSYGSENKVRVLLNALSNFETNSTDLIWYYEGLYNSLTSENPFKKYELGYNKVQSLKPFQNGKVEIVFDNREQAQQFAREYCGVTEVVS